MKKRILSLILAACLILSLSACGGDSSAQNTSEGESTSAEQTTAQESAEKPEEETAKESDEKTEEETAQEASDETSPQSTEKPAEESAETSSELPTLEDFLNSDMMKATLETAAAQYEDQGYTVQIYAQGDQLHFDFTVTSLPETTEEERAVYAEALETSMASAGEAFGAVASQVKDSVSNEVVDVVITYLDGAGNTIYTVTFSSADV